MVITGRGAQEIADSVERAITGGGLGAGAALPPIRELAGRLGVSPNTVASAYRVLRERGLVETGGRRGTRVRAQPVALPRDIEPEAVPPGARDAASGNPDPRLLPDLGAALAAVAARRAGRHPLYGDPAVSPDLLAVARESFTADGVPADALTVTSGALDGIDRVLRGALRTGDGIAVEDPGWTSGLDLAAALGLRRIPMRVDGDGPLPEDVDAALRSGARAVLVTSRAQNPTGAALTFDRAERLRVLLAAHPDVLTVEDDHGFGFVDLPFRRLAGATGRWAVVRSVAKGYGPDLRLALLAGDPATVDRVRAQQRLGPGWVSHVLQEAFVELWRSGAVDPGRAAHRYRERRDALVALLARHGVTATGRSGVNVWVAVPDEATAVGRLLARGWAVTPGARFRTAAPPGIRVTVSALDLADLPRLADDIALAVQPGGPRV
ncbi:aminotransferase class I/II-fold pyridoxal phosphate-dependent enzyme [Marinitenerispora sediminis]|uniref:GntR family transcriptional regulator n=1 Tax=Marinitenerispora sediminis TaxID=1931232 RepID=A0A368TCE7_9ACTN|nr:aminotransferase class I/II-fold pyridoxal phosphate-dependent enzyme [Marinitenerispora sediminis]RCV54757.1 GntR family transcriptional regulator [Marinitenerispora sediminis]RCV60567.1 GntR family transcriptional regulator [Marinitenerispora sediminis]RCV61033.1 GntR family transcriptional regulator [Marinitenerispora sediminis]